MNRAEWVSRAAARYTSNGVDQINAAKYADELALLEAERSRAADMDDPTHWESPEEAADTDLLTTVNTNALPRHGS